jgi:hypothetical protein
LIALVATAAVAGASATVWQAQAASFQDPIAAKLKNYTPIHPAACRGWGHGARPAARACATRGTAGAPCADGVTRLRPRNCYP